MLGWRVTGVLHFVGAASAAKQINPKSKKQPLPGPPLRCAKGREMMRAARARPLSSIARHYGFSKAFSVHAMGSCPARRTLPSLRNCTNHPQTDQPTDLPARVAIAPCAQTMPSTTPSPTAWCSRTNATHPGAAPRSTTPSPECRSTTNRCSQKRPKPPPATETPAAGQTH